MAYNCSRVHQIKLLGEEIALHKEHDEAPSPCLARAAGRGGAVLVRQPLQQQEPYPWCLDKGILAGGGASPWERLGRFCLSPSPSSTHSSIPVRITKRCFHGYSLRVDPQRQKPLFWVACIQSTQTAAQFSAMFMVSKRSGHI